MHINFVCTYIYPIQTRLHHLPSAFWICWKLLGFPIGQSTNTNTSNRYRSKNLAPLKAKVQSSWQGSHDIGHQPKTSGEIMGKVLTITIDVHLHLLLVWSNNPPQKRGPIERSLHIKRRPNDAWRSLKAACSFRSSESWGFRTLMTVVDVRR